MADPATEDVKQESGRFDTVNALLSDAIAACATAKRSDLAHRLQVAAARMARPSTILCVVGEYKTGKSLLVNALLGEDICPVDDDLATSAMTVVQHAERPRALVRRAEGDEFVEEEISLDELETYVSESGNPENKRRVEMVEVGIPNELLAEGLTVIDTPGVGGVTGGYADVVLGFLPMADAVLVVTDASSELSPSEMEFLGNARTTNPQVIVAVTRVDLHVEWRRILATDQERLGEVDLGEELVPVSSVLRWEGLQTDDDDLDRESGIPDLIQLIRDRAIRPAKEVSARRALGEITAILGELSLSLRLERQALEDPEEGARALARLESAHERVSDLHDAKSRWNVVLQDGFVQLRSETDYRLRGEFRALVEEFDQRLETVEPAAEWEAFSSELQHKTLDTARSVFEEIDTSADSVRERVVAVLQEEPGLSPVESTDVDLAELQALWGHDGPEAEFERAGVVASTLEVLRGSYGGVLLLGMFARLVAIPLLGPLSLGLGAAFGARQFTDLRKRRQQQRRQEARTAVRKYLDQAQFEIGNQARRRTQDLQRELRDYFASGIEELLTRYSTAAETMRADLQRHQAERDQRLQGVLRELGTLEDLGARVDSAQREIEGKTP